MLSVVSTWMGDRAIKSSQSVQATITCCIKMVLTS
jgi:hypothetical protein